MSKPLRNRKGIAQYLTEQGFRTAEASLATWATRGGGPPFRMYGVFPLYDEDEALEWARYREQTRAEHERVGGRVGSMLLKKMRPLTSKGSDLGANVFPTRCTEDNTETALRNQYEIDVVGLLAARTGVNPISIRHQLDTWAIGARS